MADFDLFVIGAGSGGVRTARLAAGFGAKVAIAEDRYMGGTCVNVGCVPKKLYSFASHYHSDFDDSAGFGWTVEKATFKWSTLRDNKKKEISRLNLIYDNLLKNAGVQLIEGRARIVDPNTVAVGDKQFSCERILIATGGWPFIPEIPGKELAVTSNEIFDLEQFPSRLLIVGGGYIAVEFAGIFSGLGAEVTLSYRGDFPLKNFDSEVSAFFYREMQREVRTLMNSDVESIARNSDGSLAVVFKDGLAENFDCVLYATGRKPNTKGLCLENTSVKLAQNGAVAVNGRFQTDDPSVFALGDVVGHMELTPVALAEGSALARYLFDGKELKPLDYSLVPTAVFSHPNIGTVGLSEEKAREKFENLAVYTSEFRHLKHTLSGRAARTFMKVVVNKSDDRVLGIHMVGEDAGEIIQGFATAMNCGVTKAQLDATLGIHPTAAEEFVTMRQQRKG
jgi:glutathione reductase (NADPH)